MQPVRTTCDLGDLEVAFTILEQLPAAVAKKVAALRGKGMVRAVAAHRGGAVGEAYFSVDPDLAYLLLLEVPEESRHMGVATALIRACQTRLPEILPGPSLDPECVAFLRKEGIG